MSRQTIHEYDNGLTLIIEPMESVQSAAFSFLVPAGSCYEAANRNGTAAILSDLIVRGAGDRDSKQLSTSLDNLGLQRSESAGIYHIAFSGAALASQLGDALQIYADILQRPHLQASQFEAARAGIEQSLTALLDEPRHLLFQELRRRCYPSPWGLPSEGSLDDLPDITIECVRDLYNLTFRPGGAILGVAGNVDPDAIRLLIEEKFAGWQRIAEPEISVREQESAGNHVSHDSTQTHIGLAFPSVPYSHPQYYDAWAATSVLGGGMSSRLFTEVREKRGLCYSVHTNLSSLRDHGRLLCYAGATTDRAQETLDVTLAEFSRLKSGIENAELERCKARAKSSLVMQQESTTARASSLARDWFHIQRVKSLEEVRAGIDAINVDSVMDFVSEYLTQDFTLLAVGPAELEVR